MLEHKRIYAGILISRHPSHLVSVRTAVSAVCIYRILIGVGIDHKQIESNSAAVRRVNRNLAGTRAVKRGVRVHRAAVAYRLINGEHSFLIGALTAVIALIVVITEHEGVRNARLDHGGKYSVKRSAKIVLRILYVLLCVISEENNKIRLFARYRLPHYIYYPLINGELILHVGKNDDFELAVASELKGFAVRTDRHRQSEQRGKHTDRQYNGKNSSGALFHSFSPLIIVDPCFQYISTSQSERYWKSRVKSLLLTLPSPFTSSALSFTSTSQSERYWNRRVKSLLLSEPSPLISPGLCCE